MSNNYEIIEALGEGTYGKVYKVKERHTGHMFALKQLKTDSRLSKYGLQATIIREVASMRQCRHRNILSLHQIHSDDPDTLYLLLDLMERDLKKYITLRSNPHSFGLSMENVKLILIQILMGVHHSHSLNILHRDIKPQNILVTEANKAPVVKVADWGLARNVRPRHANALLTNEVVTMWYRAPELLLGSQVYGKSVDVWSIGIVMFQMLAGHPLVTGPNTSSCLYSLFQFFGTPLDDPYFVNLPLWSAKFPVWPKSRVKDSLKKALTNRTDIDDYALDLLAGFLQLKPSLRITCKQAIWHPFLNDCRDRYLDKSSKHKKKSN